MLNIKNKKVAKRIRLLGENFFAAAKAVKSSHSGYVLERVVNDAYIVNNLHKLNVSIGVNAKVGNGLTTLVVYVQCFTDPESKIEYLYLVGGDFDECVITVQTIEPPEWVDYEVLDMIQNLVKMVPIAAAA